MVENIQKGIPKAAPLVRQVRVASNCSRSHHASESRWRLLQRTIPGDVQELSQPQECTGAGWYDDASWTWGDYYDDLAYITYE